MTRAAPPFEERLVVPWWLWPAVVLLALVVAAPVHGGAGGARAVVPYVVAVVVSVGGLLLASRGRTLVADGVLHVPGARVPVDVVGGVRVLDGEQARRLRGPAADVRAHVAAKPWLRGAVQVRIEDPDDDTPYWYVSSARPHELAEAIERERLTAGGRGPSS